MTENNKINPQMAKVEIGIRHLRTIIIWPLSVGDQLSMSDLIASTLSEFLENQGTQLELVTFVVDTLQTNLKSILKLVIDESEDAEKLLFELTNEQSLAIITVIFEQNYGSNVKNAKSLFEKVSPLFLVIADSTGSSQQSVNGTDIDSETSSSPSEEAASL